MRGGIITERARDLIPEGFRRTLPPRVQDSGRIFRAIDGLEELYETKGSGAAPEMLRREMGLMYSHDMEATLGTQVTELDVVDVSAAPGAASTTTSTAFSFPTMLDGVTRCARHRVLQASMIISPAVVANFEWARLRASVFGDPSAAVVDWVLPADIDALASVNSAATLTKIRLPLWGRRESEYTWDVRSTAGGATAATLQFVVMLVPQGVSVPR